MASSAPSSTSALVAVFTAAALLATTASAHGCMTQPRSRGCLVAGRTFLPQIMDASAPRDYCCQCQNAGGVSITRGGYGSRWTPYEPMTSTRGNFGLCGDPVGNFDHMQGGKFTNPPSMPYVASYAPGGVANFEFDATAGHGGYLEFYLCDVSNMPNGDISWQGFGEHCHYLERVPHASCESGNDIECGPVDQDFPGRWVLPCGSAGGDTGDQVLGGENGKMQYRIPNVQIEKGVVQMYWLTQNSCTEPSGFMDTYSYPQAWGTCVGDGGSIGGKPQHTVKCDDAGEFPEEFWNCADVQVLGSSQGDGQQYYDGHTGGGGGGGEQNAHSPAAAGEAYGGSGGGAPPHQPSGGESSGGGYADNGQSSGASPVYFAFQPHRRL